MAAPQRLDLETFTVDLLLVTTIGMTVRDRETGAICTLGYDHLSIGANEAGEGYTLILPRTVALAQGLRHAA